MYHTDEVNSKLKHLRNTIYDTSNNLKSLDYLLLNPLNQRRTLSNYFSENSEKNNSFSKIEQSLENISTKQNRIEDEMKRMSSKLKDDAPDFGHLSSYPRMARKAASTNYLDLQEPLVEVASTVNRKLLDAQDRLRNERMAMENRISSCSKVPEISADLKILIDKLNSHQQAPAIDNQQLELLTKRIIKSESENSTLKFEFDSLKRQFSNEMGAKNALMTKLETGKSRIHELEEQTGSLKKDLDRMALEAQLHMKKAENQSKWMDKLSALQSENEQLRRETRQCNHPQEIEELRRQKEKVERDRASIKDQMSDMAKQMDSKQTHLSKLMEELRDFQENLTLKNAKFHDLEENYHESQNELKHQQQIYQDALQKVDSLEYSMIELEAKKNKGFSMRDDNIERLESQCTRFKSELDKTNNQVQESNHIIEDLHKENEILRTQLANTHSQTDVLRREMEVLIKARSVQDEILKRREEENESCRNKIQDLQLSLETMELNGEKYKFDADIYSQDLNQAREAIAVQDERLRTLTGTNLNQTEQLMVYKSEISSLTRKVNCSESQIDHLHTLLNELRDREEHVEELRRHLAESQNCQEKMSSDIEKKTRKMEFDKENNLKKMEQMLEAERAALKVVMNKCDRQVLEINRLHLEYWNREQLVQRFRKKYVKAQQDLDNLVKQKEVEKHLQQSNFNEEILEQELEINVAKQKLESIIEERDQTLRWIIVDVDGVVELLTQVDWFSYENSPLKSSNYLIKNCSMDLKSCPPTSSSLSTLGGLDISKCFIDIKSKISWLRSEINRMVNHLENYRNTNIDLQEELNAANEKVKRLEGDRQLSNSIELEEAKRCIAKLRVKEKNETNLQLKCDRLQDELQSVRQYLNGNLVDCTALHCQKSCCHG